MSKTKAKISRRELLKLASPLGKIKIDASRCTGCGLCAQECPTEALAASVIDDSFQILFKHSLCIACGQCLDVCPEKCLSLERAIELNKINQPAVVLFTDRVIRCRECGNTIGTETMISKLRERLPALSKSSQFELCPECKSKAQFNVVQLTKTE